MSVLPLAQPLRPDALPGVWRGSELARLRFASVPSGFASLDAQLPGGGWPVGLLTELLPAHEGIGELRALGPALARLSQQGRKLAWIAPPHLPYAPALAAAGIDAAQMIIVRTQNEKDTLWAAEQALASNACGAVLAWLPGKSRGAQATSFQSLRRLQLAAESGEALAFLFRTPACEAQSSPAALRLALATCEGGLAVRVFKRRGAPLAGRIVLPALAVTQRKRNVVHAMDRDTPAATAARDAAARLAQA